MDITITSDWTFDSDYKLAFAKTSDPRVLAVIEREEEYGGGHIDGDVFAPAFYWDRYNGGMEGTAGSTFMDDESERIMNRLVEARDRFYHQRAKWAVVERYLRIFHGTTMAQVSSSIDQDTQAVILNTPTWREHIGFEGDAFDEGILSGDIESWTAALGGEVFGIGYATLPERVLEDDEEIDLADWNVEIEVWGYLGEDYAKQSAADFEAGTPTLPVMLNFTAA